MKTRIAWIDKIEGKTEKCIYDLCYNPSGTQLIVASGQHVLVYESNDGALIQLLKGHKDVVYCVCYAKDGKKFASGSADKTVIIWTSKLEGLLKYSHNEAVQSMQFNPVSSQLLSCSLSDIAIWTAEQKAVQKFKSGGRINCCAWTKDGQYMVLGLASGYVSIRNKNGEERLRIDRSLDSPIWSLACSPAKEDTVDVICIGEWGGILSFYTINGKLIGKEKSLNFTPLKILYFPKGEYILISGSNKQCLLLSRDGIRLGQIGSTFSSWAWSCMIHPESSRVTIGCQDGTITNFELSWNIVHGLYVDRYAYRENMTDIVILHLITNQKVRIKCKDLIQNIAVYRDRLAVQLPERVLIYEPSGNIEDIHYQIRYRLSQSLECNLLVVTTSNLIVNLDKRLRSLSFTGVVEREWLLDDPISYIKIVGGPPAKEHLLAGLTNGQVLEFYLDNPFPSPLVKVDGAVHCVDISSTKEKLAIVTNQRVLFVFDIFNDKKVQEFQHVTSAAFHTAFEEMISFSGQDRLAIKLSNFSEYKQKCSGIIFGLHGSKMFCLHGSVIISMEIPLSSLMYQYLESKIFDKAYIIACLGVADSDWLILGITALNYLEFNVAYKAFTRIKKLHHAEILSDIEEKLKSGEWGREACLATAAASMGKLRDAAKLYQKAGLHQEVLDMYSDLRMFDIAQEFISNGSNLDRVALLRKRAEWANSLGEPRAAAEIFFSAGDVQRAIKIISEYGWTDMLIKVGRELDKADRENLILIAKKLKQLGAMLGAAEIFNRLGNDSDVADVLVDAQAWNEAFELVERNSKLRSRVYGSYARWLVEIGRFSEAENAFRIAGQSKASIPILNILLKNAVSEKRFQDASYFYWLLSQLSLDLDKNTEEIKVHFMRYHDKADIYYAYHKIYTYLEINMIGNALATEETDTPRSEVFSHREEWEALVLLVRESLGVRRAAEVDDDLTRPPPAATHATPTTVGDPPPSREAAARKETLDRSDLLMARADHVHWDRVELEHREAEVLQELQEHWRATHDHRLRDGEIDYIAWAGERREARSQERRWLRANADAALWRGRQELLRQEVQAFQQTCAAEMTRLSRTFMKATLPAASSVERAAAHRTEVADAIVRFRQTSAEQAKALQSRLNTATSERRKAEERKRLAGEVERGRDCPNGHNHDNYDVRAPSRRDR